MKLLLWACIVCVAFAKKKIFSNNEQAYNSRRYPINPSLSNPYPVPENDFSSFGPPKKNIPSYPGHPDPETGVAPYPWILNNPSGSVYNMPKLPIPTWSAPSPSAGGSIHSMAPSSAMGPYGSENMVDPAAYEPQVEPRTETPATGEYVEMAMNEPDEVGSSISTSSVTKHSGFQSAVVPEPQSSNSFSQVKK